MWSGKFMARYVIRVYNVLIIGGWKILEDDADKTKVKVISELNLINKTAYNELILAQEYTVCFQIVEEAKTKDHKYGDAGQVSMAL